MAGGRRQTQASGVVWSGVDYSERGRRSAYLLRVA